MEMVEFFPLDTRPCFQSCLKQVLVFIFFLLLMLSALRFSEDSLKIFFQFKCSVPEGQATLFFPLLVVVLAGSKNVSAKATHAAFCRLLV